MTFYNNRVSILELDKENLYLFQNIKNEILMNHYELKSNINRKEVLCTNCSGEFDAAIISNTIYVMYQDLLRNLHLVTIANNKIENISLTEEPIEKVFELNIFNNNEQINMIYISSLSSKDKIYRIFHNYIEDGEWNTQFVIDITVDQALNPIKLIQSKDKFILCFYNGNEICIKELDSEDQSWGEAIKLTDGESRKLYFDLVYYEESLYLVYSQFQDNNYVVKYDRFTYDNGNVVKEMEEEISNESNCSNPTIIMYDDIIWIVWNESNRLNSRFSEDRGNSWSPIYHWKESLTTDIIRYKYIVDKNEEKTKLDYSFGTLSPEIKFLGFGPLDDVVEVPTKKKVESRVSNEVVDEVVNEVVISQGEEIDEDIEEIRERLRILEYQIEDGPLIIMDKRIQLIEEFLISNTRGHFQKVQKDKVSRF